MKYLRLFNEELMPSTYLNAAYKLKNYKHHGRASELENWASVVRDREHNRKVNELREKISKRGTFTCSIYSNIDNIFTGNFYIDFDVDEYSFLDNISYAFMGKNDNGRYSYEHNIGIPIWVGFMPADDETAKGLEGLGLGDEHLYINSSGLIYSMSIDLGLTTVDRDSADKKTYFNPEKSYLVFDTQDAYVVLFSDRRNAIKFKRLFIDMITNKSELSDAIKKAFDEARNNKNSSGYDNQVPENAYERLISSISSRFSINKFYRD
jgi:hypothetical protein